MTRLLWPVHCSGGVQHGAVERVQADGRDIRYELIQSFGTNVVTRPHIG